MWRFVLPLVIVGMLFAALWAGLFRNPGEVPSPHIGRPVPEFALPELHDPDNTFTHEALRGRISLLNVFGTWCPGCHEEHPLLMAWAAQPPYGVPIYGLNWKDDRDAAIAWLQRDGNPYERIAFDAEGDVAIDWGVYGAPETFLIDSSGRIRLKHIGVITESVIVEKLIPAIEALRAEEGLQ